MDDIGDGRRGVMYGAMAEAVTLHVTPWVSPPRPPAAEWLREMEWQARQHKVARRVHDAVVDKVIIWVVEHLAPPVTLPEYQLAHGAEV